MAVKPKVVWSIEATIQLKAAYNYIAKDSIKNAGKVRNDIVEIVKGLPSNPEVYPPDKYKINNDGSYHAFEKHRYRISYHILEEEIRILGATYKHDTAGIIIILLLKIIFQYNFCEN